MTVSRLGEDEWQTLQEVRMRALTEDPAAFGSNLAREQGFTERHWRMRLRSGVWFVAAHDGVSTGLVSALAEPGAPADDRHVMAMWVAPERRRTGVAGQLLAGVAAWARDEGAATLSLWLVRGNDAGAAAYARYGFTPTGESMALPRDPTQTEDRWVRRL